MEVLQKKDILIAAGIKGANYLIITIPILNATIETVSIASQAITS
jgi:hypothetical protein